MSNNNHHNGYALPKGCLLWCLQTLDYYDTKHHNVQNPNPQNPGI